MTAFFKQKATGNFFISGNKGCGVKSKGILYLSDKLFNKSLTVTSPSLINKSKILAPVFLACLALFSKLSDSIKPNSRTSDPSSSFRVCI